MSLAQPPDNPTPPSPKGWRLWMIKFLRGTINVLNSAIATLEQPSTAEDSLGSLGRTYSQILGKVRNLLPVTVRDKLPDWGLSGAIALFAILVFSTTSSLLFPSAKPVTTPRPVAIVPSPEPLVAADIPPVVLPETPPLITPMPEASPDLPENSVATNPVIPEATPEPAPEPTPEAVPNPSPEPMPEPVLTPEQTLIAAIQTQVTEIIPQEAGLITAIKPNFPGSLLKIIVSQNWYDLDADKQDQVAAKVEERSQDLDFRQLLITDATGHLVARKAVVGRGMIILRRLLA